MINYPFRMDWNSATKKWTHEQLTSPPQYTQVCSYIQEVAITLLL